MAYEFTASLNTVLKIPFEAVAEVLSNENICVIESMTPTAARFRWAKSQRREVWPEDAELSQSGEHLLLTIHTGTRHQREQLVNAVSGVLSKLLFQVVLFEES